MRRPLAEPLEARRHFAGGTILFVRGADRSGGFEEATSDAQRTEELADINNTSTATGNHGWGTLANLLRSEGYTLKEVAEPLEKNAPATGQTTGRAINFQDLDLKAYAAVVMGSNNAVYSKTSIDALDNYVHGGGGVLFISDGNFGSSWADAPASDNQFLSRYGLAFDQDNGRYALKRADGDFALPNEPILRGINAFDGEGVSPVRIAASPPAGVTVRRVAVAMGETYDNNPTSTANGSRGTERPTDRRDASLALANAGGGRVAAFFDRNTFFNANGAGTDLSKNDNRRFATNLFNWVTDAMPPAVVSSSFNASTGRLSFRLDDNLDGTLTRSDIRLASRRGGPPISSKDWSLALTDGDGYTDVTLRLHAGVAAGPYQLQVPRRAIADDSGNVRTGAIRYAFTVAASVVAAHTFAQNPLPLPGAVYHADDDPLDALA